jgi:chromosome partitioning protein
MTHVAATINLKGGVGKTTLTVAIAETLAGEFGRRVLVIDLDPQTNATVMLIGEKKWDELNSKGHTLHQLFADALAEDPADRRFDPFSALQRDVSPVQEAGGVDLLPSSLDMIDVQDRLASIPPGRFYANNPIDLLSRAVQPILEDTNYDWVLIDCPPNLGIITLNGLRIADGYVIPTIPDVLSTYGIPQILSRVEAFSSELRQPIPPYGIVISKYRAQARTHRTTVERLRNDDRMPNVFQTMIPEANDIAQAAEYRRTSTLRQRWGYQGNFDSFMSLTKELIEEVEG